MRTNASINPTTAPPNLEKNPNITVILNIFSVLYIESRHNYD